MPILAIVPMTGMSTKSIGATDHGGLDGGDFFCSDLLNLRDQNGCFWVIHG